MAALIAPIDIPAIQMDVRLGEGLVDAGLIGTECSPPCNTRATVSNGRCRFLKGRHSVPRAFLRGALDSIMSPVKGRPSSKIRKIAEAAEKANSERQVKSVMFRGEKRL
jgi:hypothetical protein